MITLALAVIILIGGMIPWRQLIGGEPSFQILS